MSTTRQLIDVYECIHCGKGFRTTMQLRCHINRARRCNEKDKLHKLEQQNKKIRIEEGSTFPNPDIVEENYITDDIVEDLSTKRKDMENEFDTGFELAKFIKSCFGGRGLSVKDTNKLIELVKHPNFNGSTIPYNNGRGANLWLNRKLEIINGPSQVYLFI